MGRKARQKQARAEKAKRPPERPQQGGSASEPSPAAPSKAASAKAEQRRPAAPAAKRARRATAPLRPPVGARAWLYLAVLSAATLVAYLGSLDVPFILDDKPGIVREDAIKPPVTVAKLLSEFRPVVTSTLALNYATSGLDESAFRSFNIALHLLCGLLVFGFTRHTLTLRSFGDRYRSAADELAAIATAVFLLHPLQTESVTYIIQRAEILVTMGMVGSLWMAAIIAERGANAARLAALAALALFAILSKQSAVVLPVLFLVYDLCFLAPGDWSGLRKRAPIYGVLAVAALIVLGMGSMQSGSRTAGFEIEDLSPARYFGWQFGVLIYYAKQMLVPTSLCFDCGYRGPWLVQNSLLGSNVAVHAAIVLSVGAAALAAWWRAPLVTFWLWGTAVTLAPTSSFFPLTDVYVEHRLYTPLVWYGLALAVGAWAASEKIRERGWLAGDALRNAQRGAAIALVALFVVLTASRNEVYSDPVTLWEDTVAQAPQNSRAHYNLGNSYKRVGRGDDAIVSFQKSIELDPTVVRNWINLGSELMKAERDVESLEAFQRAAELDPEMAVLRRNLAVAYSKLRRAPEAIAAAEKAIELDESNARGHKLLAELLYSTGRPTEALVHFRRLAELDPNDPDAADRIRVITGSGS